MLDPNCCFLTVENLQGALEDILQFIYAGELEVQPGKVTALLDAAEFYQVDGLAWTVLEKVKAQLQKDPELIFFYYNHGKQSRIAAYHYLQTNFSTLARKEVFKVKAKDFPLEDLFILIDNPELMTTSESDVFQCVADYITRNRSDLNDPEIAKLFSAVRWYFVDIGLILQYYEKFIKFFPKEAYQSIMSYLCNLEYLTPPKILLEGVAKRAHYDDLDIRSKNLLLSCQTGGQAKLIAYEYYNGSGPYNPGTLDADGNAGWANNGALVETEETKHSPDFCFRQNSSTGSTWSNTPGSIGVLIVDLTQADATVTLSKFSVFQMESDGATTGVRIFYHPSTTTPPTGYSDQRWIPACDEQEIGGITKAPNTKGWPGTVMRVAKKFRTDAFDTRFIKIEATNDGRHGQPCYIELMCIKGFP